MTSRKRAGLSWLLGAALATTALTAPATVVAQDGDNTLRIAWQWDPTTMDPQMHRQRYTQIISHAMRDKLHYFPPPGLTLGPLLAESVTQVDETTYDIKIHEGVLFHDGDELTSEDVVYTFERLWDPATESPRARMGNMPMIEGVEAIDRYTIRWNTKIPFGPPDVALIGFHVSGQEMMKKSYYENMSMEEAHDAPVIGVGPFKYVEWVPDQRVIMDAFPDYWQGKPGVDRIVWQSVPEEATRVAELLSGSVDMAYPVGPDFVEQVRNAGMTLEVVPGSAMRMLMMNVREDSPFADVEVRRAMNMAIDKDAIVEFIYSGLAVPFEHVAGVGQEGHIEGYDPFPYDPEAARAVLSKVTEPIELFVQQQFELPAEAIAEQLRGYGMDVTTVVLDRASHNQTNEEGTFDLLFGGAGYGNGQFVGAYTNNHFECARLESTRIRTGLCDENLDALIEAVRDEADIPARNEKIETLVRAVSEDYVPWVPLFGTAEVWAMQPYVKGFRGSTAGQMYDLWKVTLEK